MKPYSITKAKQNLQSAQTNVESFKTEVLTKGISAINDLIDKNTLVGINSVDYSFALLQSTILDSDQSKEDRLVKYKLLNQLGLVLLTDIYHEFVNNGYSGQFESGAIRLYISTEK